MLVGLTYDLRDDYLAMGFSPEETAEFDKSATIDAIDHAIQNLGHSTDRIGHVKALVDRLSKGETWDLVFNIAEGFYGLGREAQVPALLDAYKIPYTFSDPLVMALTLHKGMTKHVVRGAGILTPDFAVIERPEEIDTVRLAFPLFVKPAAEGTGKGITEKSKARNHTELRAICMDLLGRFNQPVLVEAFLPGREFTVGIAGTGAGARSIGVMEIHLRKKADQEVYSYANKEHYADRVEYTKAGDAMGREAEEVSLAAWRALGCRDAGRVDVRADAKGRVHFIEVNPLAGLNPDHSDLPIICRLHGIPFQELIRTILKEASRRVRK